MLSEDKKKISS
jgi:hypothetical protein